MLTFCLSYHCLDLLYEGYIGTFTTYLMSENMSFTVHMISHVLNTVW